MIFSIIGFLLLLFGGILIGRYFLYIYKSTEIYALPQEQMNRLKICDGCDRVSLAGTMARRCRECGCFIAAKARLLNQECPLGKWDEVQN